MAGGVGGGDAGGGDGGRRRRGLGSTWPPCPELLAEMQDAVKPLRTAESATATDHTKWCRRRYKGKNSSSSGGGGEGEHDEQDLEALKEEFNKKGLGVQCVVCGERFGLAGYGWHVSSCYRMWQKREALLPPHKRRYHNVRFTARIGTTTTTSRSRNRSSSSSSSSKTDTLMLLRRRRGGDGSSDGSSEAATLLRLRR